MDFFRSSEHPQREWDKKEERKKKQSEFPGMELFETEKVLRSFAVHCSSKVHVSDVSIMC